MIYMEDDLLPLSAVSHLVFCERRCALIHIEGLWGENIFTAQGRVLHDKTHREGIEWQGDTKITRGLRLRSLRLGLSGVADVVEFHPGGTGPPVPFPVEYKRGIKRHERSFEIQLCAQAMCLEEMLGVAVPKGALFYGKSARRQEVVFDAALRSETAEMAARLHALFEAGRTPPAVYEKKCESCSLLPVCKPRVTGGDRSARKHLDRAILESLAAQAEAEDGCAPRGARGLKET